MNRERGLTGRTIRRLNPVALLAAVAAAVAAQVAVELAAAEVVVE
jgi:hypothetical protein